MVRKDLVIAIVVTFCITAALFTIILVRNPSETGEEATKNVHVTNWPTQPEPKTIVVCQNLTVTPDNFSIPDVYVEGYRYGSIFVAYSRPYVDDAVLVCCPSCFNITGRTDGMNHVYCTELKLHGYTSYGSVVSTNIALGAPYLHLSVEMPSDSAELTIAIYCYN